MLKYLFSAQFSDGSEINQEADDASAIEPGRSAFFDVMEKVKSGIALKRFSLFGPGLSNATISLDLRDGVFTLQGAQFGVNPATSDIVGEREIIFFRVHQKLVVMPARFVDPTGSENTADGNLIITDRLGNTHDMGRTAIVAQEQEYVDAEYQQMDKSVEGGRLARVLYVLPHESSELTFYDLGWKGKDAEGKAIQQVVRIQ